MTKLTDTQRILLSAAAQHGSGSVWPLPYSLKLGGGTAKAIAALVRRELAEERETGNPGEISRRDGDFTYGVFITAKGEAAIGVESADGSRSAEGASPTPDAGTAKPASKQALAISLLRRSDGATMAKLIEVTGWLPHTTRAALTGIRKRGHDVSRSKRDGGCCQSNANRSLDDADRSMRLAA